jgi:tRNA pseudouridine32 synthase/23S rRNA pseudouridine746 synthase/23S rRNA pseudouridine1911/1915/1917 synthase
MSAKERLSKRHWPKGVVIIYEDRDILVVEKPPGLLTMGTDRVRSETLYYKLTNYVRKGNPKSRERVFIVHRLDREASGILVFARHEQAKSCLQGQWQEVEKKYLAVVHGRVIPRAARITSYLAENQAHIVYSTMDATRGKLSRTAYSVLREKNALSLLEIDLLTGRKHQIRVHLAEKGHSIVGDKKYGNADKMHKRLALHATSLSFNHPSSGERVTFETKIPKYFAGLMGPPAE